MKSKAVLVFVSMFMCSVCFIGCSDTSIDSEPSSSQITTEQPATEAPTKAPTEPVFADIDNPVKNYSIRDADRDELANLLASWSFKPQPRRATLDEVSEAPQYRDQYIIGKCDGSCSYQKNYGDHCCVLYPIKIEGTVYYSDYYGNPTSEKHSETLFVRSCDGHIDKYEMSLLDWDFNAGNGSHYIIVNNK